MAIEASALAVAFLSIMGGSLARAAYPFLQEQKNKEDELRALDLIPPEQLTPEQKQFIENASKPLNFLKYYKYTAILGVGASIVLALSSLTVATQSLPSNATFSIALGFIPIWLLAGWGGGDASNQFIKSGNATSSTVNKVHKAVVNSILSNFVKKQKKEEQQEEEINDSI